MSIRKVVAGLLITAGIAIMAVPFFWRATGEKQTEQLISEFEQTLEDDYDEEREALVKIERGIQHIQATQLRAIKNVLETTYDELLK